MKWDVEKAFSDAEYRVKAQEWCRAQDLDPSLVPTDGYVRQVQGGALVVQLYVRNPDAAQGVLFDFAEDKPVTEEKYIEAEMPHDLLIEEDE